jgi:hypothetical protein
MCNCLKHEGGPSGFGDQESIPSHRKLLWPKAVGGRELGAIRLNRMRHTAAMRERELQAEIEAGRAKVALREARQESEGSSMPIYWNCHL